MLSPGNNKTNTWTLYASHNLKTKNNNVNSERIKHIKEPIHVGKQTTNTLSTTTHTSLL